MTIKLLCAWNGYPANAVITLDAGTEAGLVAAKLADTNTSGGTTWSPPDVPVYPEKVVTPHQQQAGVVGVVGHTNNGIMVGADGGTLSAGGGGGGASTVKSNNASVSAAVTVLDFSSDFGVTESPAGEVNITAGATLARVASPAFTGTPAAPTASNGTNTTQLATTAFVQAAIALLLNSAPGALDTLDELAAALGDDANFAATMTNALALKAPIASPALTGTPTAPTAAGATDTTQLATTAFVRAEILSRVLTGLSAGTAGAPAASDTVLQAFAKLVAIVNLLTSGSTGQVLKKNSGTNFDFSWAADATAGGSGFPSVEAIATGSAYTLVAGDANKIKVASDGSPQTINITTAFNGLGCWLQWGAGVETITLDAGAGVNLNGLGSGVNITLPAGAGMAQIIPTGTNTFNVAIGVKNLALAVAAFLADPTSAKLRTMMADEDGDGALLFAVAPVTLSGATNLVRATHGNRYLVCSTAATHTVEDDTTGAWVSGDVLYGDNTSAGNVVLQGDGTSTVTAETGHTLTVAAGRSWSLRRTGANAWIGGALQAAGSGDFSSNTSSSVDSELVLFSGTGGKTGKRATGSGLAVLTSGVLSTIATYAAEATVASATTTDIGAAASINVSITGTTTITGLGTVAAGIFRQGRFTGALTLTHNATSLILPGGANITTAAGDRFGAYSLGSGNWVVIWYTKADGTALAGGAGGGDFSSNTASSIDGEVIVFSGTGGKTGKRATGSGLAVLASGVMSAIAGYAAEATVASATTADIGAAASLNVSITGTTTITGLGTVAAGTQRFVRFTGALTLTHNATSLILPGGANIATAAGDSLLAVSLGSGNWVVPFYQRANAASIQEVAEVSVASAATTDIGAAASRNVSITGTTTITALGTVAAGITRMCRFTGALTLTHNATSLILPAAANITTAAGDRMLAVSLGSGNWVVMFYQKASGASVLAAPSTSQACGVSALVETPSNKTYPLVLKARYAFTITEVTAKTASGTCTIQVTIDGTNVTGGSVSVTSTEASSTATAANSVAAGQTVAIVVTSNSSAADLQIDIGGTRTLA